MLYIIAKFQENVSTQFVLNCKSGKNFADFTKRVPEVIVQRFGLIARPVIIWSANFFRECSRKVAHSRNSMVLAKLMFIFLNERSFFTFSAPLTCLDHIPFELLLFGPTRYEISEKIRALACPLFEISTVKVYVHDVGLCTASTISRTCDLLTRSLPCSSNLMEWIPI